MKNLFFNFKYQMIALSCMLVGLCAPFNISAQDAYTADCTGGSGTYAINSGLFDGSLSGSSSWKMQTIIMYADELNGPMTIKNFAFQQAKDTTYRANGTFWSNISVYIRHVGQTKYRSYGNTLSQADTSAVDRYIHNANIIDVGTQVLYNQWIVLALEADFEYNGNDNLEIIITGNNPSGGGTSSGPPPTLRTTSITYDRQTVASSDANAYVRSVVHYETGSGLSRAPIRAFPFTAFNMRDDEGNIKTTHGAVGPKKAITEQYIPSHSPSQFVVAAGNSYMPGTDAFSLSASNGVYNCIYKASDLGATELNNAPLLIKEMKIPVSSKTPETYDVNDISTSYPVEVFLRNTTQSLMTPASGNPNNAHSPATYYQMTGDPANGGTKVFSGTLPISNYAREVKLPFQNTFLHDGTSNVELLFVTLDGGSGAGKLADSYNFIFYAREGQTGSFADTYGNARGSCNISTGFPTIQNSGSVTRNVMTLSVTGGYETGFQKINAINLYPISPNRITNEEHYICKANIETVQSASPKSLNSIRVIASPNDAVITNINVYTAAADGTFTDPVLIGSVPYVNGTMVYDVPINEGLIMEEGNNWIGVTAEVDVATTPCNAMFIGSVNSMTLDETVYSTGNFTYPAGLIGMAPIVVDFEQVSLSESRSALVCYGVTNNVYDVITSGPIESIIGERKDASDRGVATTNTTSTLTVTTQSVLNGDSEYRMIASPVESVCLKPDTLELNFDVVRVVSDLSIEVYGNNITEDSKDTVGTCLDAPISVTANHAELASSYEGQYYDTTAKEWLPISVTDIATAAQKTILFAPVNDKLMNCQIRAKVTSDLACAGPVFAFTPSLIVKGLTVETRFLSNPQRNVTLCRNAEFTINANYNAEVEISRQGYKDGYPLEDYTDKVLVIDSVKPFNQGVYGLEVTAQSCTEGGIITIVSDTCELTISPIPIVIWQTTKERANPGEVAGFSVEADVLAPTDSDIYRGYRHDLLNNIDIPIEENYSYIGTKSNYLTIYPVKPEHYTYNGDYYFCEIVGDCGGTLGATRSNPIYLLPGENLSIIDDPADYYMCINDTDAVFEFDIGYDETVGNVLYQGYLDGVEITDSDVYQGATTKTLTVDTKQSVTTFGEFTCKAGYEEDDPTVNYVLSTGARIYWMELPENNDTIEVAATESSNVMLAHTYISEYVTGYTLSFINSNSDTTILETGNDNTWKLPFPIEEITLEQAGIYVLMLHGPCDSVSVVGNVTVEEAPGSKQETGINDELYAHSLTIIPNPASESVSFTFNIGKQIDYICEVLDVSGATVGNETGISSSQGNIIKLDINNLKLSNGTYIFNLKIDNKQISKTFVIAK